jgi:predicted dehydrogenase
MHNIRRIKVGVVGCGNISNAYFHGLGQFPNLLEVVACADLDPVRAKAKALEKHLPHAGTVDELLGDPDIDLIVNLTVPKAHAEVNLAALRQGKHVYCEKPFSLSRREGAEVLDFARGKNLLVGTAPDTFLGAGLQTCRKLMDDGAIGEPVAATAFMVCRGHEGWHPSPEFYYEKGGGPLFDMGPYYLTALVSLLGPVRRVTASARATFSTRTVTSDPKNVRVIPVETPTHYSGTLDFTSGAVATMVMSFDIWGGKLPCLEIYGTEGTLGCPDPNQFHEAKDVYLMRGGSRTWEEVPLAHTHRVGRGMGVADMAKAIVAKRDHRCAGELGCHVVEVMEAFEESSRTGRHIEIKSTCRKPDALPVELGTGMID